MVWLLFQWANTIKFKLSVSVEYKADIIIISFNVTSSCHDIADKHAQLALNNNHLLTHLITSSLEAKLCQLQNF
jgi:hypothetical protein